MTQHDRTPNGPTQPVRMLEDEDLAVLDAHYKAKGWKIYSITAAELLAMDDEPPRWRPVPLTRPGKFKCQTCDNQAVYVTILPWVVSDTEPISVAVECKRCGIANDAGGYWFDLPRWFDDGPSGYTMRHHVMDDKRCGEITVLIVDAVLEEQRIGRSYATTTSAPKPQVPQRQRYAILQRDGFKCSLCGRTAEHDGVVLEVDHMQARSKGGTNDDANLWTLCRDCNGGKLDQL